MSGLAYVDTETMGLDPELNPIWEVAVIVDDAEHVWQQRVPEHYEILPEGVAPANNSTPYVSQWVLDNTRFEKEYRHKSALTPADSIRRFAELVEGRHLVGAVPSFDEERLRRQYRMFIDSTATKFPWHYHLIDVETLAVGFVTARGLAVPLPWSSDRLSEFLGIEAPVEDRHTALGDARWAKAIYERVMR